MSYKITRLITLDLECDTPECDMIGHYTSKVDTNECHFNAVKAGWKVGYTDLCPRCNGRDHDHE